MDTMAADPGWAAAAAGTSGGTTPGWANTPFSSGRFASRAAMAWACAVGSKVV